ncbi:MAG: prolyl oligopeptidase family serine peptidase [Rhodothermales bacterium]
MAQQSPPLRQSNLTPETVESVQPLALRDAARDAYWLGVGVQDARWAPDGRFLYFRWPTDATPAADPAIAPWYRVDRAGQRVEQMPDDEVHRIPAQELRWDRAGARAVWVSGDALYLYDDGVTRPVYIANEPVRRVQMQPDGRTVQFMIGEDLYRYDVEAGIMRQCTSKHIKAPGRKTEAATWLEQQQLDLFERQRNTQERREGREAYQRHIDRFAAQPIPVEPGVTLDDVQLSPDGQYVTFTWHKSNAGRKPTQYLDYATASGYAQARNARPKVGEPQDTYGMGIVRFDPTVAPDEIEVIRVTYPEQDSLPAIFYGPTWSLEGNRAVVQIISQGHKDQWISRLDLETGHTAPIIHDHDDAWLGGPPPLAGYRRPVLLEWLPGGRFVFASERTGWSHLYLAEPDSTIRPLTEGAWEVRGAQLSRDRTRWLLTTSREHPSDDHLYLMPAAGGDLVRLTEKPGRHAGYLSPDGERLAVVYSESIQLPDLFLRDAASATSEIRITVSGTDQYYRHAWVRPEVVSFPHPDGGKVWAALFTPEQPNGAGVLHIHGGGYRQFSHRGWSVYGYPNHLGLINYLVQQGYTVLDLDYRGSAGFGRDYRTDIYRSMGVKDVESAVAGAEYLAREHGVDPSRVGIYGLSYGGFMTLMSLFRYPGVFAAGVANAAVSDWAHYNHLWTSRILNQPYDDPEAYDVSSPINHAEGLDDALLIVHGLIDNNVHFQDAARVVQRLIELEKEFEVMYYPMERHTIQSESSRYDYVRRVVAFFETHLLRPE